MATCIHSTFVGGQCGSSKDKPEAEQCVTIENCQRDIKGHLKLLDVRDGSLKTEAQLLLARAGLFECNEEQLKITVCSRHRDSHGIRWRCNKRYCTAPIGWTEHKEKQFKGNRGLTSIQSEGLYGLTKYFLPVGSPICRRCRTKLKNELESMHAAESSETSIGDSSGKTLDHVRKHVNHAETATTSVEFEESKSGSDSDTELAELFDKITIADDPSVILSDETNSSASSEPISDSHDTSNILRLETLNTFLKACSKTQSPIGQPRKRWESMSMHRRNIHASRATSAIVAVLEVISPKDAGCLWEAVQDSRGVETVLEIEQPTEKKYIEALAETYHNATSWETRRQVLAMMADLVSLRQIQKYVPGITEYRFKVVRLHILLHYLPREALECELMKVS